MLQEEYVKIAFLFFITLMRHCHYNNLLQTR